MANPIFAPQPPAAALEVVQDRAAARCLLHPVRLRIVEHLVSPDSASGVGRRLKLPRQKVNYHLRELERHGLVRLVREARHGAGTERRLQARARAYALGPRLLGRLSADRALAEGEAPEVRIVTALTRAVRDLTSAAANLGGGGISGADEVAGAGEAPGTGEEAREGGAAGASQAAAMEVDLVVADGTALRDLAQDLQNAVEFLSERYRSATGLSCHLVLAVHPAASYGASLPPPIAGDQPTKGD